MKYLCEVCETLFKHDDEVVTIRPGVITDPSGIYIGISEELTAGDTIHKICLPRFLGSNKSPEEIHFAQEEDLVSVEEKKPDPREKNAQDAKDALENMGEPSDRISRIIQQLLANKDIVKADEFVREYFKLRSQC